MYSFFYYLLLYRCYVPGIFDMKIFLYYGCGREVYALYGWDSLCLIVIIYTFFIIKLLRFVGAWFRMFIVIQYFEGFRNENVFDYKSIKCQVICYVNAFN